MTVMMSEVDFLIGVVFLITGEAGYKTLRRFRARS